MADAGTVAVLLTGAFLTLLETQLPAGLLKPLRVPRWLDQALGLLRYFYLGLAVLFAAMGAAYVICRYDPFVSFFRMSARFEIWIWSGAVLGLSLFVGRP